MTQQPIAQCQPIASTTSTKQDSLTQLTRIAYRLNPIALSALIEIAGIIDSSSINLKSLQEIINFAKFEIERQKGKTEKRSRSIAARKPENKSWMIGE